MRKACAVYSLFPGLKRFWINADEIALAPVVLDNLGLNLSRLRLDNPELPAARVSADSWRTRF